jgi:purine-binding chemotaxis protein CheW
MTDFIEKNARRSGSPIPEEGKFLTFRLADEEYGIRIKQVREIVGMAPVVRVPEMPTHVLGVVNLRGKVIPVLDLRLRFQMEAAEYDDRTCIVVVERDADRGTSLTGIVVDAVSEVLPIAKETIQQAPSFGADIDAGCILGIATTDDGVTILLDIEQVLISEDALWDSRNAA